MLYTMQRPVTSPSGSQKTASEEAWPPGREDMYNPVSRLILQQGQAA